MSDRLQPGPFRKITTSGAVCWVLLTMILVGLIPAQAAAQSATPLAAQTLSDAEVLARKYAPIAYIREQPSDCDPNGEPYLPAPVEVTLGAPDVTLRRHRRGDERSDPVVVTAPTAQDLVATDDTYYLDLPGNPRQPGCAYERWARDRMAQLGLQPTVYARVATEPGSPHQLALQYWFYWAFDDFNNTHESDWEMVQLMFAADTAGEALGQDPSGIAFSQHAGGESADWDDVKLQRDGDQLIVYPAVGSHATYYGDSVWLGWGEQGTGFGCDNSSAPIEETPLQVVLLPEYPDSAGPLAWLLFQGRWGERQPWEFNGPLGPNASGKWATPISWTDDIRVSSLSIPTHKTIGPGPAQLFCAVSGVAGSAMTIFPIQPWFVGISTIAVMVALLLLSLWNRRYILAGIRLYFGHPLVFVPLSAWLLVVAFAGVRLADLSNQLQLGQAINLRISSGGASSAILGLGLGSVQQFLILALVAPGVIHATWELRSRARPSFVESWRFAVGRLPRTVGAQLINALLLGLMTVTIVLIPLALIRGVQWLYTPHAVAIEGASFRHARHVSRRMVKGRWWRTLGMSVLIWLFAGVPGPIVGNLLLVTGVASLNTATLVSTLLYAVCLPITVIASTLYFLRAADKPLVVGRPEPAPQTAGQAVVAPTTP